MVDIQILQTVSIAVASAGILVAAIYYVFQLRHQAKIRQTDLVMRLYATFGSTEFQKAYLKMMGVESEDYADYVKKYGADIEVRTALNSVGMFFEGIGVLAKRKLISMDLVDDLFSTNILQAWEKIKPVAEGVRKKFGRPQPWEWFEYLYNEMQKREQQLAKAK
jgi:hypothetical protein